MNKLTINTVLKKHEVINYLAQAIGYYSSSGSQWTNADKELLISDLNRLIKMIK